MNMFLGMLSFWIRALYPRRLGKHTMAACLWISTVSNRQQMEYSWNCSNTPSATFRPALLMDVFWDIMQFRPVSWERTTELSWKTIHLYFWIQINNVRKPQWSSSSPRVCYSLSWSLDKQRRSNVIVYALARVSTYRQSLRTVNAFAVSRNTQWRFVTWFCGTHKSHSADTVSWNQCEGNVVDVNKDLW
jgi:hypothetical protein